MTREAFEAQFLGSTVIDHNRSMFLYSFPGGKEYVVYDADTQKHLPKRRDAAAHFDWLRSHRSGIRRGTGS